jgi:hypothetical protein
MPAEDAVDDHAQVVPLEIDPVIADAEAVQDPARALEFAEVIQLGMHDLLGQSTEFAEDLELQFLGHLRQLRGAGGIKNDLEGAHFR